jgi:hypothetical protein
LKGEEEKHSEREYTVRKNVKTCRDRTEWKIHAKGVGKFANKRVKNRRGRGG